MEYSFTIKDCGNDSIYCNHLEVAGKTCMKHELDFLKRSRDYQRKRYERTKAQVRKQVMKLAEENEKEIFYGDTSANRNSSFFDRMINGAKRFFDPNYGK